MQRFNVRAPATSANVGPAFDCLGIALDFWNEATFTLKGEQLSIEIRGEGEKELPRNKDNLIYIAFKKVFGVAGEHAPSGLTLNCQNRIPLASGLGSSSAAILIGLLAANHLLDNKFSENELLQMGAELEGHADNLAAGLLGGLVLVRNEENSYLASALDYKSLQAIVVLPDIKLSTAASRKALPKTIPLQDASTNIANSIALAEAFRNGDIAQLSEAMRDQLHQPYRLKLLPGAEEALKAARTAGAAVALSGAGPSLIAFVETGTEDVVTQAMQVPFAERDIATRQFQLQTTSKAAEVLFPRISQS